MTTSSEIDKLITEIETGNIDSWSRLVVYATLNGIPVETNLLVMLLNNGDNRSIYDFLYSAVLESNSADGYITDEFLATMLRCDGRFRTTRNGYDSLQSLNPRVWMLKLFRRIPKVIMKYLLSFEKQENQHVLDSLSNRSRNLLVDILFLVGKECWEAYHRTHTEKLLEIATRIERLYQELKTTTVSFN